MSLYNKFLLANAVIILLIGCGTIDSHANNTYKVYGYIQKEFANEPIFIFDKDGIAIKVLLANRNGFFEVELSPERYIFVFYTGEISTTKQININNVDIDLNNIKAKVKSTATWFSKAILTAIIGCVFGVIGGLLSKYLPNKFELYKYKKIKRDFIKVALSEYLASIDHWLGIQYDNDSTNKIGVINRKEELLLNALNSCDEELAKRGLSENRELSENKMIRDYCKAIHHDIFESPFGDYSTYSKLKMYPDPENKECSKEFRCAMNYLKQVLNSL